MGRERYGWYKYNHRFKFNAGWKEKKNDDCITLTYKDKNIFMTGMFIAESSYIDLINVEREYLKARTEDTDVNIITDEDKRNIEKVMPSWIHSVFGVDGYIEAMAQIIDCESDYLEEFQAAAHSEAVIILNSHKKVNLVIVKAPFRDKKKGAVFTVKRLPDDKSSGGRVLNIESNLRVCQ